MNIYTTLCVALGIGMTVGTIIPTIFYWDRDLWMDIKRLNGDVLAYTLLPITVGLLLIIVGLILG